MSRFPPTDLQKPSITCPADQRKTTAYQASYNQVWFQLPEASDNSGRVNKWCDPASGSVFHLGNEIVLCYAEDEHGNHETCSFEVEVYGKCLYICVLLCSVEMPS